MKGRIIVPLACIFLAAAALLLVGVSRETKTPRRQLMQLDPRTVELKSGFSVNLISPLAEGGCDAKWINPMKKRVEENPEPTKLTKKIFILWQQGFENAPEIVQIIRDSWIVKNPTWEVIQVTDDNVKNLLEGTDFDALFSSKLSSGDRKTRAAYSDIIRLFLLEKYGGVWADASALCTVPLDSWLPFIVDDELDFFGFRAMEYNLSMKQEYYPLSSWFLYGTPKSPIIQKWKKEMISYWDGRTVPHAYFWLHYNLFHVFEQNNDLARKWMQSAILDRTSAHYWQNSNPVGKSCSGFLGSAPVQKLSHYSKASLFMSYLEAVEENRCGLCVDGTDCNKDSVELFESLKTWCKA